MLTQPVFRGHVCHRKRMPNNETHWRLTHKLRVQEFIIRITCIRAHAFKRYLDIFALYNYRNITSLFCMTFCLLYMYEVYPV